MWSELSDILAPRASGITAAVTYVGSGGAEQLPLRSGSDRDDATEEALHLRDELSESLGGAGFRIDMFWWDEPDNYRYNPNPKYSEGAHAICAYETKSGQMRPESSLAEPGRIVRSYTDVVADLIRTYYYLHVKEFAEAHTLAELRSALEAIGDTLVYGTRYFIDRKIDALLGVWSDIEYDE